MVDTNTTQADANVAQMNDSTDVENNDVNLQALQAQLEKQSKLIEKFRQQEKANQEAAKEAGAASLLDAISKLKIGNDKEIEEWQTKFNKLNEEYSSLRSTTRNRALDSALSEALTKAGVADVNTALKLVDKGSVTIGEDLTVDAESITKAIEALRQSDPVVFAQAKLPDVKLSAETGGVDAYKEEISKAKTIKELQAIAAKYGK